MIRNAAESEEIAASVPDTGGVYLVPAFTGLGAPWWDMYSRGLMIGMTRGTGRAHIVRAALESIAFQSADLLDTMARDCGFRPRELKVDGGASANALLMQFEADIMGIPVVRPQVMETTALGAAFLAGLGVGVYGSPEDTARFWKRDLVFEPRMEESRRADLLGNWHRAVERARGWAE
jgi:glycerol kinase